MKKALESTLSFLLSVLTTIVILVAVLGTVGYAKGWRFFNVETGSMSPSIPPGTLIITRPVNPDELKPGDVVTYVFNQQGDVVTHRLVSIDLQNNTFVTRGNANNTDDAPENIANIIGKVVFAIPKIGPIASLVSKRENRPYLISLIAMVTGASILLDVFLSIKNKGKKEKEESQQKDAPQSQQKDNPVPSDEKDVKTDKTDGIEGTEAAEGTEDA